MSRLLTVSPRFLVADIHRAADYYRDALGFTIGRMWGDPPSFCIPHRDGLMVMLGPPVEAGRIQAKGADGETWDAYFHVEDANALHAEFAARGALIVHPPVDRDYYGCREFAVQDPDGHILAFAHEFARVGAKDTPAG